VGGYIEVTIMTRKFKCPICGKTFNSKDALGGHMSSAHPKGEQPPPPSEPPVEITDETSQADKVRALYREGYTAEQIINKWGLPASTVYDVLRKEIPPEGKPAQSGGREETALATLKKEEVIPPEFLLRNIDLPDGSYDEETLKAWSKGIEDGFKLVFAGVRVVQQIEKSQLEMYKSVKSSESEIAERAAREAAGQVAGYFERTQPWKQAQAAPSGASPFERMMGPVADMIGQQMAGLIGRVLGAAGGTQGQGQSSPPLPQGWTYEEEGK